MFEVADFSLLPRGFLLPECWCSIGKRINEHCNLLSKHAPDFIEARHTPAVLNDVMKKTGNDLFGRSSMLRHERTDRQHM